MPPNKAKLVESDDESGSENGFDFKVNETFAEKYEHKKKHEELSKLKDQYGANVQEDDDSTSEEEDSDAEELTPTVEKNILKTIAALKNKDPRIYDPQYSFFEEKDMEDEDSKVDGLKKKTKQKEAKPMYLKDYERKRLQERGALAFVSDDEDGEQDSKNTRKNKGYHEEVEDARQAFLKSAAEVDSSDEDEDDGHEVLMTKTRKDPDGTDDNVEADYLQWLKGSKKAAVGNKDQQELEPMKKEWSRPDLDEKEQYLRDYILNEGWRDHTTTKTSTAAAFDELHDPGNEDEVSESEDEEAVDEADRFEAKFNFRFEEEGGTSLKSYPRVIDDSVRNTVKSKRAEKAKARKERKSQEKLRKAEELRRLEELQKENKKEKLEEIKKYAGSNLEIDPDAIDLDGDFDPDRYDQQMQKVFNDMYYDQDDAEKPEFSDLSDVEDYETSDLELGTVEHQKMNREKRRNRSENGVEVRYDENGDPIIEMDADAVHEDVMDIGEEHEQVGEDEQLRKGGRRRRDKSKFMEAVRRPKPRFDPKQMSFDQWFDKYYDLSYEDIVADQPTRFKYRKVVPNDYGLEVDEVLRADDKELNQWVSVKKLVKYRSKDKEKKDQLKYRKKGKKFEKKLEVFKSLQDYYSGKGMLVKDKKDKRSGEDPSDRMSRKDKVRSRHMKDKVKISDSRVAAYLNPHGGRKF
eukprot:Clim_evm14s243 gene=Clim_evmTU14s243